MTKTVLLATAAMFAFAAAASAAGTHPAPSGAGLAVKPNPVFQSPKGAKVLYSQNSNSTGVGLVSQNFSGTYTDYDSYEADDFIVPKGRTWTVGEVDVTGDYFNGSGPSNYEDIYFYRDADGMPGKPVKGGSFTNFSCTDISGSFTCVLPKRVKLKGGKKGGHYWVSVVADMDFTQGGEWGWEGNSTIHHDPAMWENPKGGFGICKTWGTNDTCLGYTQDNMFDLKTRGAAR